MDFLIKIGSNVNQPDKYGLTPLHHAAFKNNFEGADFLIKISKEKLNINVNSYYFY